MLVPYTKPITAEEGAKTDLRSRGEEMKGSPGGTQGQAKIPAGDPAARVSRPESNGLNKQ